MKKMKKIIAFILCMLLFSGAAVYSDDGFDFDYEYDDEIESDDDSAVADWNYIENREFTADAVFKIKNSIVMYNKTSTVYM